MIDKIGPPSPEEIKAYQDKFLEGANLFKEALNGYSTSNIPQQKLEFKKVMNETLKVMNQSASFLMKQEAKKYESELNKDFQTFKKEDNPNTQQKLKEDIDNIQKEL